MLSIKVVNGNLVTRLKKVWISRDHDGWYDVWQRRPRWGKWGDVYLVSKEEAGSATSLEGGWNPQEIACWFERNIRNSKNGPLLNALPGPGELWEVKLI